jgi:hypothetical protein
VLGPADRRREIAGAADANGGVVLDCAIATQGVSAWREDLPEA